MNQPAYKFYPTLLDCYSGYLNSSTIYNEFWGFSENPTLTEEEFEQKQFQELIDKINRMPFDSEAADKGTAFNEVVDCIIENRKSERMEIKTIKKEVSEYTYIDGEVTRKPKKIPISINVIYNGYTFDFNYSLCRELARRLEGAITQQRVEGLLSTRFGDIMLYGNMDHILPFKAVDLKTTSRYSAFKFRNNWQHRVYLFCLRQMGVDAEMFEYLVTDFKNIWEEVYRYDHEVVERELVLHCESFIEFIEQHKHLITDKKVFAKEEE